MGLGGCFFFKKVCFSCFFHGKIIIGIKSMENLDFYCIAYWLPGLLSQAPIPSSEEHRLGDAAVLAPLKE